MQVVFQEGQVGTGLGVVEGYWETGTGRGVENQVMKKGLFGQEGELGRLGLVEASEKVEVGTLGGQVALDEGVIDD